MRQSASVCITHQPMKLTHIPRSACEAIKGKKHHVERSAFLQNQVS